MARNAWFETVAEAQRRAKKRLPRSVYSALLAGSERGVTVFNARIHEREAYRALFSFGGTLASLDPAQVPNIPAAVENARAFAAEAAALLKASRTRQAQQVA